MNATDRAPAHLPDTRNKRADGVRSLAAIRCRCRIDSETGCWLWAGAMSNSKTRRKPTTRVFLPADVSPSGKTVATTAAKAAWILARKPLPEGHVVWRVSCRCPPECVNPAHRAAGTRQEMHAATAADGRLKGDPVRAAIAAKNRAVLLVPHEKVRQAEALFASGMLQKDVMATVGIAGKDTIRKIRLGTHPNSTGMQRVVRGASVFSLGAAA